MFSFLRKKDKKETAQKLLIAILEKLPAQYSSYLQQVYEGVIRDVSVDTTPTAERISILYNTSISKKYDNDTLKGMEITGISVKDLKSNSFFAVKIYLYSGLVIGLESEKSLSQCEIDYSSVNIHHVRIKHDKIDDSMRARLSGLGITKFNDSEIYEVNSDGDILIHLRDLDDGDFLAVNEQGFFIVSVALRENIKLESQYAEEIKKGFLSLPKETLYSFITN